MTKLLNLFKDQKIVYQYRKNQIYNGIAQFPNGKEFDWTTVKFQDAVTVLPIIKSTNKFLLLKQYRPAIKDWCIEQVAGGLEDGTPLENAKREVLEEIGYQLNDNDFSYLGEFYSLPGLMNFKTHFYIAYCNFDQFVGCKREETELIETFEISEFDFYEMVKQRKYHIDPEIMITMNLVNNSCFEVNL